MQYVNPKAIDAHAAPVNWVQPISSPEERPEISVIVPVYNSAATLSQLVERLKSALETVSARFEIILVDDCGPQAVWPIITDEGKNDSRVKGVRLSRNFGQHAAITAGLMTANANWYVVMDCDLQDRPEDIPSLYNHALQNGHDSVVAVRKAYSAKKRRQLGSFLFNKALEHLADIPASAKVGNFRVFNDAMAQAYRSYPEKMRLFPALMSHVGFNTGQLELERQKREEGTSNYTIGKLLHLAFDSIISNTIKPMYYLAGFGFLIAFVAIAISCILVLQKLFFGIETAGWTSIMTAIMLVGGLQISVMSFVGVYVGKVFFEVKNRPVFIVSEASNIERQQQS